jgi:O-antigen/teichoic acid export membrane protein
VTRSAVRSPTTGSCATAEPLIAPGTVAPEPPLAEPYDGRFAFAGSLRTRAARGTIVNSAFTVGLGLLTLLRGFVLAAYLTPGDYGVWGVLAVSLSTLLFLKQAGVGDKFVQQDERDQEAAFQRAFTLELVFTVACVVLIAVAVPLLILIYDMPQLLWPSVVIAATLLVSVLQAPLWIYYRRMEFVRQRTLQAVDPMVGFVVAVGLAIAGAGYWAFVGGMAAGACAASAVAVWHSPLRLRLRWERGRMGSYWSFSAPLLVAGAAGSLMASSAALAAKLDLGVAAVGVITLAYNVSSFTDSVDQLVTGALYPAICAVRDRTEILYESLVKSNRLTLMWGVPFGVGVTLFCSDLVHFVLGERWLAAITLLQIYGVTAAINHVGFNWTAYFRALERTRPIAVVTVVSAAIFMLAGIPLLIAFGLRGFAAGVAAQALGSLVLRVYYLGHLFPGFDFLRHAVRAFVPTVPAAAVVLLARLVESGGRTLGVALAELAGYVLIAVAATVWLERELLNEALRHVVGRPPATTGA